MIYNAMGQLVKSKKNAQEIHVALVSNGVYYLIVNGLYGLRKPDRIFVNH